MTKKAVHGTYRLPGIWCNSTALQPSHVRPTEWPFRITCKLIHVNSFRVDPGAVFENLPAFRVSQHHLSHTRQTWASSRLSESSDHIYQQLAVVISRSCSNTYLLFLDYRVPLQQIRRQERHSPSNSEEYDLHTQVLMTFHVWVLGGHQHGQTQHKDVSACVPYDNSCLHSSNVTGKEAALRDYGRVIEI